MKKDHLNRLGVDAMKNSLILELIEICDKKILNLNKIYDLTKNQGQAIEEDKLDLLQNYTKSKQNEIDKINILDDTFTDKYGQYKGDNIDPNDVNDCELSDDINKLKGRIEKISQILTSISELELDNNSKICESFTIVKAKLKQIRQGKSATKGYSSYKNMTGAAFINETK